MSTFLPKAYDKEQITIRISSERLAELEKIASQLGMSRNQLINQCVDYALQHLSL